MQKKLVYILVFVLLFVLVLNSIKDIMGFLRKNLSKFEVVNVSYYKITKEIPFSLFFPCVNVIAPSNGSVEYLKSNFDYVKKDELIAKLYSKESVQGIYANESGIFLVGIGNVNETYSFDDTQNFSFVYLNKKNFSLNEPIGCIVSNNNFFVGIKKEMYSHDSLKVLLNEFLVVSGIKIYEDDKYCFYEFSYYLDEFLKKKSNVTILLDSVYGIKIPKSSVIADTGKKYVYIVNGNIIKKVEIKFENVENDFVIASLIDQNLLRFNSFIIVRTPHLFKPGEIVGNF
ncbi:MAG: hypothetical protein K6343_02995 [Caldisericaceae bacterium]